MLIISLACYIEAMESTLDFDTLLNSSRARVYLLWAFLTGVGFTATHFYQNPNINIVWFVISAVGFFYMYKVMPLGVNQMKKIYLSWIIPVMIGLIISVVLVRTDASPSSIGYLGPIWLLVMASGYLWNGLSDNKGMWYYVAALVNAATAGIIYTNDNLLIGQYLIAAIVSVWSMLMLWVFYSDL